MGVALRVLPAVFIALGMVLQGCGEKDETPLGPSTASPSPIEDASIQAEKQRNSVDLGPPTGASPSLMATASVMALGATSNSIPFDPEPGPFTNSVLSCDDCTFSGLPIGFSFVFFGNRYTTFNVSTNGFIGFTDTYDGCCSGGTIPSNDAVNNIIAAAWTDLFPGESGGFGRISYETRGRAPNRYLIVDYSEVPWYGGDGVVTTQIILYEGSNAIEIHTANQSAGHIYTQGIEDATGTQAAFVPGRVAANYSLAHDAVRFNTTLGSWVTRTPLPSARRGPAVAVVNGTLYSIGGRTSADVALRAVNAYSASSNSWTTRTSLPAAREGGNGAAAIGSTIYLAGGFDANRTLTRTLYAYNTSTNSWSTRANMPRESACGGSAVISGKLYVFTGCRLSSTGTQIAAGSLHRYDPSTNAWTTLPSAPSVHTNPAVGVISGKLYVAGGDNASSVALARLDVYDPATNGWSTRSNMPTARVSATAAVVGGKLHVIGGRTGSTYLNTVEAYDPATTSWTVRASMPTARSGAGVGVISNLVYAVGGRRSSTSVVATNERYTP
jgi:N-acetylneuraminic acid mutarotase